MNRRFATRCFALMLTAGGAASAQTPPPAATPPAATAPAATAPAPDAGAAPGVGTAPPPVAAAPPPPLPAPPPPPPPPAPASSGGGVATPPASAGTGAGFMSLRLMREKGIITQAEYDSAIHDLSESVGRAAPDGLSFVLGKWSTTMYGFVEADGIWDSTRSFNDIAGSGQVARSGTIRGDNSRFMMSVRNSRIGFRLRAPETHGIRASAKLEMDFLGTELPIGAGQPYFGSEGAYFTNPTFRIRHFNLKLETPIVDVLIGQSWQLLGWQGMYQPNTVEYQGVPGELYARTPQLLVQKTIKTHAVTVDVAAALARPVQRDSSVPDGQAGVRLAINQWTGWTTNGSTGTNLQPASIALTGNVRKISVDEWSAAPKNTVDKWASAMAVDLFVPVLPGTKTKKANVLSLTGEFAYGYGDSDFYTGLSGGVTFPAPPNPTGASPAPTYPQNIDNGIATYDLAGGLHTIQWTSFFVGAQYYLPILDGRVWVSGNYSHIGSNNTQFYGAASKTRSSEDWFDANVFADLTRAVRFGVEYAHIDDHYNDGATATNHRVQLSAFYIF